MAFIAWMKFTKWMTQRSGIVRYPLVLAILGGGMIGLLGVLSPSSLFWSENELQWAISMGNSSLPYAWPSFLPHHTPLLGWELAVAALVKMLSISITVCIGFPGGIIFPLIFVGALMGEAWCTILGIEPTVAATAFMSALMASVLRTPWAAVLIVLLTVAGSSNTSHFIETFPLMLTSVMVAMVMVYYTRFYGREQHGRRDLIPSVAASELGNVDEPLEEEEDNQYSPVSALFNADYGDSVTNTQYSTPLVPSDADDQNNSINF